MSDTKILFNDNMKLSPNRTNSNYLCFSNHYVCNMYIDNREYNHVEGFVESSKYIGINDKVAERIRNVIFPGLCKKISKENPLSEEHLEKWTTTFRVVAMKRAVYTKFLCNSELAKILLKTGDKSLIYNSTTDDYWGTGSSGTGSNILGKILEEVRDIISDLPTIDSDE